MDEYTDEQAWHPKTRVGKQVKEGQIRAIEDIFASGKTIKEVGYSSCVLPNLEDKVLEIASVQRMTLRTTGARSSA